jgi:hypothetical protein
MTWQLQLFLYWALIVAIAGGTRWLGASRLLAFAIPTTPLVGWLINALVAGSEDGNYPAWILVAIYLALALPPTVAAIFLIPKRHDNKSA